jgi:hypothetical protein
MKAIFSLKEKPKRNFDVNNKKDLDIYKKFLTKGGWGAEGCPFVIEHPYVSIPYMIQEKIVKNLLNVK